MVQKILPALRVIIAKELIEKHGLKRKETAERMWLTPAAITQYLNKSRGDAAHTVLKETKEVMSLISDIANDLIDGGNPPEEIVSKICQVCQILQSDGVTCK